MSTPLAYPISRSRTVRLSLSCAYRVELATLPERQTTAFQKQLFLQVLEKTRGTIQPACDKSDTPRSTFYHWFKTDPHFKNSVDEIRATKPDILEDRLYIKALEGNIQALIFLLKSLHENYRAKPQEGKKETVVHIHHHTTPKESTHGLTLEDIVDDERLLELYLKKFGNDGVRNIFPENTGENVSNLSNSASEIVTSDPQNNP